jgi:sRNA-binding carbon storage regulator CsrA
MGITAPRTVAVHREEIFERIKREEHDEDASATDPKAPLLRNQAAV